MKKVEKLWNRFLSCGHERLTNIAFINGIYIKPKIGNEAYCRECCENVKIIKVKECKDIELKKELNTLCDATAKRCRLQSAQESKVTFPRDDRKVGMKPTKE